MDKLNKDSALAFLRAHQPMPTEEELSEADIQKYDEIREYFIANPDKECIPLFLGSFPYDSGFGVYQLVDEVFRQFPLEIVLPHLRDAMISPQDGVRSYAAEFALEFSDDSLIEPLSALLEDKHCGIRSSAIIALESIGAPSTLPALEAALTRESDTENRKLLTEVISKLRTHKQSP